MLKQRYKHKKKGCYIESTLAVKTEYFSWNIRKLDQKGN